jgi:glycosidase
MKSFPLQVGAFGEAVKNVHRNLTKHGFTLPSSELERGFFGPGTRYAVMQLQRTHGLPTTGAVDERINAILEAAPGSCPVPPTGTPSARRGNILPRSAAIAPQRSGSRPASPSAAVSSFIPSNIFAPEIARAFIEAREAAAKGKTRNVTVNGTVVPVSYPFPSPTDWRDCWMYFLMIDRFANDKVPPKHAWNLECNFPQGGTFKGVTSQLNYLQELGVKALWLSPVLKNSRPDWEYNYHGYGTQDFLHIDGKFGSDGTLATAEKELAELIAQAHGRGIYVILDMVLNHASRVFDYVYQGEVKPEVKDPNLMEVPPGQEPPIQWLNGLGFPRQDWQDQVPPGTLLSPDDVVYPSDLQEKTFFRRRGDIISYDPSSKGFVLGDFGQYRQLVVEFDATVSGQEAVRAIYGPRPVLNILIQAYQYLIAKFDFDGFRIDTAKHIAPLAIETFGNAIREFAQTIGKRNFFTFGEIYDNEERINQFVGRHSPNKVGFGIDAALDYPLYYAVTGIVKGFRDVSELPRIFDDRKKVEANLISSHGEAGQYFVTFLDNHDQPQRFNSPSTPRDQVTLGLALLFCLQGIPAIYYGTEQGLQGVLDAKGDQQSVREALWGKQNAFDRQNFFYAQIKILAGLREKQPALRFGRLYFREVSANNRDFGPSLRTGGVVAFSRVVSDIEVLVVANTNTQSSFHGHVLLDPDLNRDPRHMRVAYSNLGASGAATVRVISDARFFKGDEPVGAGSATALYVELAPLEVKVWVPEEQLA